MTYPDTRVFAVVNGTSEDGEAETSAAPWSYAQHAYRDNTTMVAEFITEEGKSIEGVYTVGAFVGDECRGIGSYVDGLLYLTIHGTQASKEKVSFMAYENATANRLSIEESIEFDGNQRGTVKEPYQLHVKATGIHNVSASSFNVYPNPVRSTLFISGDIHEVEGVKILAANGRTVVSTEHYTEAGINVTSLLEGVYVVAIHTPGGYFYKKILKVN